MITSTIKFSQIEDRIDAEYFKQEYLLGEKLILNKKWEYLADLAETIQYGTTPEEGFFVEEGVPFIRSQNFSLGEFRYDDLVKCTPEFHQSHQRSKTFPKDILIAAVGATIGEVGIVPDDIKEGNINQNIARVRLKNKGLAYFVAFFLGSEFGKNQLFRHTTRTAQGYLNTDQIESIKIPIPSQSFQQKIEKMVKKAYKKRKLADEKYKEAEEILNRELGLEDLDLSIQKSFVAKFSEAKDRLDPEYYKPIYKKVYKSLEKISRPSTEICKVVKAKISPQSTPEKLFRYIEISGINNSIGEIEKVLNLRGWQVPSGAKYIVKSNDVLLSAVRTYLRGIALVGKEYENSIATTGFHIFRDPIINPEVLFLFLRSRLGLIQFEKFFLGSTYPVIKNYDLKNILIPVISNSRQQKISSLIQESFKLRREAKKIINKAKKEVEEMVENR